MLCKHKALNSKHSPRKERKRGRKKGESEGGREGRKEGRKERGKERRKERKKNGLTRTSNCHVCHGSSPKLGDSSWDKQGMAHIVCSKSVCNSIIQSSGKFFKAMIARGIKNSQII
jgi:hypothetical protein